MSHHYCVHLRRFLGVLVALVLVGCGNEFRPVAIPIIPPVPPAQAPKQAVVISTSPAGGTATNINVSGDNVFTVRDVPSPVHAALAGGSARTFIANDNDTLSTYLTFGSLTFSPTITITLPAGSKPVFVHSREAANVYVALSGSNFDPVCGASGGVGVVSITTLALTRVVCTGGKPVALAQLPNGSKLYAVNQDTGEVVVINTADFSIATRIAMGGAPSAIEVSADGAFVYVAINDRVTVINTLTDQPDPRSPVIIGASPNFLKYGECPGQNGGAPTRKRIYTTNPGSDSVTIIDADPTSATFLTPTSVTVGDFPTSLTQLANCTKVYVANSGITANSVSVIDGASLAVTNTVPVGISPISIDSSPDSAQVFVLNQGDPIGALTGTPSSGNVSVIRTSDDARTIDIALPPPPSLPPPPPGTPPPVMTPKLLIVTP